MNEIAQISSLLTQTFTKNAWHGPSVKEVLATITAQQSVNRLPNTHSIIELVNHMASWRRYVTKKLQGDYSFAVTEELNFHSSTDWPAAIRALDDSQKDLLEAIELFPAGKLAEQVPHTEQKYSFYTLLHGIIHHDLYHTGQIMLIQKATGT